MKFKIVPEIIKGDWTYSDRNIFRVYYKDGFFSSWNQSWFYNTVEEAEKALPKIRESLLSQLHEVELKERLKHEHLNQKPIYKVL